MLLSIFPQYLTRTPLSMLSVEKYSFMGAGDTARVKTQIAEDASSMILYEIIRMRDVFRSDIDGNP